MPSPRLSDQHLISPPAGLGGIDRLRALMHRLRAPGGCPWDAEQSHRSLIPNLLEEAYEVLDAIERDDMPHLLEELGDLLLQVVFHSELAEEAGHFDMDAVGHAICEKLVRRHPHVFGTSTAEDPEAVLKQWDKIKRAEKGTEAEPYLHGTGDGLPALMRAAKLQKKAAKVGFDWPDARGVLDKIREELDEVSCEYQAAQVNRERLSAELGDLLFSVVNLVRKEGLDPEAVMSAANRKFTDRFHAMEARLLERGMELAEAGLPVLEEAWEAVKD